MHKYRIKLKASKIINGSYEQVAAIHRELTHVHSNSYVTPDGQTHIKQLRGGPAMELEYFRRVSDILARLNIMFEKVDFFTSEVMSFEVVRNAATSENWTSTAIEL